jgi:hypothetical protein
MTMKVSTLLFVVFIGSGGISSATAFSPVSSASVKVASSSFSLSASIKPTPTRIQVDAGSGSSCNNNNRLNSDFGDRGSSWELEWKQSTSP